jgi:glyoxylase-like metal-dependent hydrolase (beta-lactamase superfamily II)
MKIMSKQVIKVADDIWAISPEGPDPEDCNIYVLKHENNAILIDAGFDESLSETIRCLDQIGLSLSSIQGILLTHAHIDHVGALANIKKQSKCWIAGSKVTKTALSKEDGPLILARQHHRNFAPVDLDQTLDDEQLIRFGPFTLKVFESPGHTDDSLIFYEPTLGLLFSGDTILCDGGIGFLINPTGDLEKERTSIQRVANLQIKALLPGHRRIELTKGFEEVQKSLEFAKIAPADHGSQYYKDRPAFDE